MEAHLSSSLSLCLIVDDSVISISVALFACALQRLWKGRTHQA